MIIRKLKAISNKILKTTRSATRTPTLSEEPKQNKESIDTQPLPGIKYLQRRQMASQKQYFDSADHFLKIYEMEKTMQQISHENLIKEATEEGNPEAAVEKSQAPLETAYSEIIDEMKPKEWV
ncbi:hypothetical protein NEMIN01_0708 [Nematocida minor]|uniref:uncharacterized protein n=1 Tax=Nematocida minor TaxID=1912983 RepID=UPI00221F8E46|nr:uncharacterized protein NEMIN01_0708 [Nematocida minor]KAI5189845.1 hypothetical protein NEMIN01_0708 [Nematocida minor]